MRACSGLVALALLAACASNPYRSYKGAHPDWSPPDLPLTGIALDETLASIYAPPSGAYRLLISKLRLFEVVDGRLTEVDVATLVPNHAKDYAVAALVWCASEVDLERYAGERVSWYLLKFDRVIAYDHYAFHERCVVGNEYAPATGSEIAAEQEIATAAAAMSRAPVHAAHLYRKGVALANVGRASDAQKMLLAGDATAARGSAEGKPRFDSGKAVPVGDLRTDEAARRELLQALAAIDALPDGTSP